MGDRFYEQQLKATGNCPGNPKEKGKPPKPKSKAELVELLGIPGLSALTIKDLQVLISVWENPVSLTMPTGRLKTPYVTQLHRLTDQVPWTRCTVATLKDVINFKMNC